MRQSQIEKRGDRGKKKKVRTSPKKKKRVAHPRRHLPFFNDVVTLSLLSGGEKGTNGRGEKGELGMGGADKKSCRNLSFFAYSQYLQALESLKGRKRNKVREGKGGSPCRHVFEQPGKHPRLRHVVYLRKVERRGEWKKGRGGGEGGPLLRGKERSQSHAVSLFSIKLCSYISAIKTGGG